MIKFKQGVSWQGASSEIILAIIATGGVLTLYAHDNICWITSIRDGQHSASSRHYIGEAFDCRSKNIKDKEIALSELKDILGVSYFVDLEYKDSPNEHYHIQRNEGSI